jgi:hypothetical protein
VHDKSGKELERGKMIHRPEIHDSQQVFEITKTINTVEAEPEKPFTHRNYYRCPNDDAEWRMSGVAPAMIGALPVTRKSNHTSQGMWYKPVSK